MSADTANPQRQECVVLRFNHFDPIWRRCWDRDFHDSGRRFVSYRAIEEAWIDDAIASCKDGLSCFMVEAAWVLRNYLDRHPEHVKTLRRLAKEGRFELLGSGENIIDANMVHGELLARNLVLGTLWAEKTLGVRPATGWHSDGFGSCAQMPQVFQQCGCEWLPAISYNVPDAPYWRGIDGSTVLWEVKDRLPMRMAMRNYPYNKLRPCPACNGKGCKKCLGRGFPNGYRADFLAPPIERVPGAAYVFWLWGEEIMPGLHVAEDVAKFNAESKDFNARQGIFRDLRKYLKDELERVDDPPSDQISSKVENNPCQTGCYATRIKIKQNHRAAEHALLAAECWDTLLNGAGNAEPLRNAWRLMTLSAFHDALPCSHCDPAYDELRDLLAAVQAATREACETACKDVLKPARKSGEQTFTLFNSQSFPVTVPVTVSIPAAWQWATAKADGEQVPVYDVKAEGGATAVTILAKAVPALGARSVVLSEAQPRVKPVAPGQAACGRFAVDLAEHGISGVRVEGIGSIMKPGGFLLAEPLLEHDFGDPWATRTLDRTRDRLSKFAKLESVEERGNGVVITYAGRHPAGDNPHTPDDPMAHYITWRQTFHLRQGLPWIEVETAVEWYAHSRRLRLAFPSNTDLNRGVYGVPYAVIERDRYEPQSTFAGNAGGDWPAVHWAGIQTPKYTFAVFDRGTPSYRIEDGTVTVSVLRAPQMPHCLLEPASYVAHNYSRMSDHGTHLFRHALYVAEGDWRDNDVSRQAAAFNGGVLALPGRLARPLPQWKLDAAHTQLTAIKPAENGKGVIVRLVELAGRAETVTLQAPERFRSAFVTSLLEDNLMPLSRNANGFPIQMKPWKIVTVRLTR